MATVTLSQAFDVISPISYTSSSLYGYSSSSVTYKYSKYDYSSSGGFIELTSYETFYGSFSFPSGGGVNGSITAYEIRNNYGTVLTADFNLDASIAYSYIKTGATTGLLNYALSGNDTFDGSSGNDRITGYGGNDTINLAGGIDYVFYYGPSYRYTVSKISENSIQVADSTGDEGTDQLINVEYIKFSDTDYVLTSSLFVIADTTAPTVSTFSPADGASSVSVGSNIVLTFNESVAKGTGSIQLRAGSATGTIFETFDAATSSRLTFSGSTLTIDPTNSLAGGTNYYVTLANGSVKDTAGNSFTGTSTYDFNTLLIFSSSAANESFSGDSGANTLICRNSAANYTLTETDTGWLISSTADGKDTISNVERLQFTDSNLALDTAASNSAGGIYRLYKAALDRDPDLGGLGYWIAQADAGTKDAVRMATDFTYATEFKTLYGVQTADNYMTGEDITALVTKIYENVLDRAPDAGGRDYYVGQITTKSKTVGQVLAEISDSTENKLAVAELIGAGIEYTPWVD